MATCSSTTATLVQADKRYVVDGASPLTTFSTPLFAWPVWRAEVPLNCVLVVTDEPPPLRVHGVRAPESKLPFRTRFVLAFSYAPMLGTAAIELPAKSLPPLEAMGTPAPKAGDDSRGWYAVAPTEGCAADSRGPTSWGSR